MGDRSFQRGRRRELSACHEVQSRREIGALWHRPAAAPRAARLAARARAPPLAATKAHAYVLYCRWAALRAATRDGHPWVAPPS